MDLDSNSSGSTVDEVQSTSTYDYTKILCDLDTTDIIFARDGVRLFHYQQDDYDWKPVGHRRGELVLYYDTSRCSKYLVFQLEDRILSFQPIRSDDVEIHQQQTNSVNWIAADYCADNKHYEFCARFSHQDDDKVFMFNLEVHHDDGILRAMKRRKSEDLSEYGNDSRLEERVEIRENSVVNTERVVIGSVPINSDGARLRTECDELRAINQSLKNEMRLLRDQMNKCRRDLVEMTDSRNEYIKEWEEMSSTVGFITQQNQLLSKQLAVTQQQCRQYMVTLQSLEMNYNAIYAERKQKELQLEQMMITNAQLNQRNEQLKKAMSGNPMEGMNDLDQKDGGHFEEEWKPSYATLVIQCNAISQSLRRFAFYKEGTITIVDGVEILAQKYVNLWRIHKKGGAPLAPELRDGNDEDL